MPGLQSGGRRAEGKTPTQARRRRGSVRLAASRLPTIEFRLAKSSSETQSRATCRKVGWRPCWRDSDVELRSKHTDCMELVVGVAELCRPKGRPGAMRP